MLTRGLKMKWLGALLVGFAGAAWAQPYDKVVDDFFNSTDPFIKNTVIPNIEKNRKSNAQVTLTDKDGKPLAGVTVAVKQLEHAFLFGSVCMNENAKFRTPEYFKLWRDIFNYGITESAFKWKSIEETKGVVNFSRADSILATVKASGAQIELHFLAGYAPTWVDSESDAQKAVDQRAHALAMLDHYKDQINLYQVYNEDLWTHVPAAKVYFDQTTFFQEISQKYPNLHLGINDCWPWNPTTAADELPTPAFLKSHYPGIKFIGMHGHRPHSYYVTPQEMYQRYDPFTGSGINVQICEFGIMDEPITGGATGNWTDALRAKYFVSAYATFFSHPATEGMHQWGMGPDTNRWTANYLIDTNGVPKPSYYSVKSLIRDKLMTKMSGTADAGGIYKYRGFRGTYQVTITKGGVSGTAQITLGNTDGTYALKVLDGAGSLIIQGGDAVNVSPFNIEAGAKPAKFKGPEILAQAGRPVLFTGLRDAKSLEILDMRGLRVKHWQTIGDRIEWDRNDDAGRAVPKGSYVVRAVSEAGETQAKTVLVR